MWVEKNEQIRIFSSLFFQQLRAECVELRRGEKSLRTQVESLTQLINAPTRSFGVKYQKKFFWNRICSSFFFSFVKLPPLPPMKNRENESNIDDLQTAIVQITLQLQSDAENVSGLTNRVAQILRDRDEVRRKRSIFFSHFNVVRLVARKTQSLSRRTREEKRSNSRKNLDEKNPKKNVWKRHFFLV